MKLQILKALCAGLCLVLAPSVLASIEDLHPLVVTQTSGELDIETSNALLKSVTTSSTQGVLNTLSRSFYATDTNYFRAAAPYRGQVEMLVDALRRIDQNLFEKISKTTPKGTGSRKINYQMFWTGTQFGDSPLPGNLIDAFMGLLTQYSPKHKTFQTARDIGASTAKTLIEAGNETLIDNLKVETFERFSDINALRGKLPIFPIHFEFGYTLDGQRGVKVSYRFLFTSDGMEQSEKDVGTAILDQFSYRPLKIGRGVIQIAFDREYLFKATAYVPPVARVNFGMIRSGDINPISCKGNECKDWLDALPTMYMRIDPKENGWFTRTKAWIASFDEFRVMVRSVGINLADMSMDPKTSDIMFHVDTYLGGKKIIDMEKTTNNWFEYFAQRQGAIQGEILPAFDSAARKSLDDMMTVNLTNLVFRKPKVATAAQPQ